MPNKKIVSNKGSQSIDIYSGTGCVVIRVTAIKKNQTQSVTIFDECLPAVLAQLFEHARHATPNNVLERNEQGRKKPPAKSVPKIN